MGTALPVVGQSKHLAATTTGVVLAKGAGRLHAVTINTPTSTAVVTIYDGITTGGRVIAVITMTAATVATTLAYRCSFVTGLFVVIATAAPDLTVTFDGSESG